LVSFAWKVSEDQLGVFLDGLEGDRRLTEPARGWNEVQRGNAEVLLSLDYFYRKDAPECSVWYGELLSASQGITPKVLA